MSETPDRHLRFRELLSDRLDGPLAAEDERGLVAHLEGCPPCRTVARDYADQRRLLAALPPVPPPRDLWARTNAALDREMAKGQHRRRRVSVDDIPAARRPASPLLMLSSLASLVLAVIVVGTQLDQVTSVSPPPGSVAGVAPTPFEIPTQELAFVDLGADGITVYQTALNEVCPQPAIDCNLARLAAYPVARIPGKLAPRGLALHPDDHKLALLSEDDLGSETISVVLLPSTSLPDGSGTGVGPDGVARTAFPASPTNASSSVATVASATPAEVPSSGMPTKRPPEATPHPTGGQHATPRPTGSKGPKGDGTTDPGGAASAPASSASAAGGGSSASSRPSGSPDDPGDAVTGGIPTLVPAAVVAILDGVRTTGAPPEWSLDGSMLAFSAMPADRSQGPDVYTWRSGDAKAQRLTSDHRSDFASWSGSRIVLSREPERGTDASKALTFVIDPANGEERAVAADGLWLPAVDAAGRWAIAWRGDVAATDRGVDLRSGELFVIDWRALDPFRDRKATQSGGDHATPTLGPTVGPTRPIRSGGKGDASPATPPEATSTSDQGSSPDTTTSAGATSEAQPSGTGDPGTSGTHRAARPSTGARGHRPRNRPAKPSPVPTPIAAPSQAVAAAEAVVQPVEPDRDVRTDPVLDWQVAWSDDGSTFGYWVADTPGANWGRLSVVRIARDTGHIERGEQVLGPTLARRAFAVGADRVAWVAASEDGKDGELRVRTWGAGGDGGLRLRDVDLEQAVPAF